MSLGNVYPLSLARCSSVVGHRFRRYLNLGKLTKITLNISINDQDELEVFVAEYTKVSGYKKEYRPSVDESFVECIEEVSPHLRKILSHTLGLDRLIISANLKRDGKIKTRFVFNPEETHLKDIEIKTYRKTA